MKVFKKTALLLTVIILAVVLSIGAIAGATLLSEGDETLGEAYSGVQVSTSGKVSLKFYYSTLGEADAFRAEVTDPVSGDVVTFTYPVSEIENTSNGYCVNVPLAPSEMTHSVKVYAVKGDKASTALVYSVEEYAKDIIADPAKSEYHDTMRALLNWGAMAQATFKDATSAPANVDLFVKGTNSVYGLNTISYESGAVVQGNTIKGSTMNLALEPGNIALHMYVNYSGSGKLTATVSKNGGEAVETDVVSTEQGWRVRIANIPASLFDTPYTVTITDGTDTFTATKTIREYLGVLLDQCNKSGDLTTGNTVRALYQFYQFVTGNTGAETCNHGKREAIYWIAADEDSSFARCNFCHTYLSHQAIDNGVNDYIPGSLFQFGSKTGSADITVMSEDGEQFVRVDNMWSNRENWGDIGLTGVLSSNTVTGQYMVIKYRVSAAGNASSYIEGFVNTNRGSANGLVGKGEFAIAHGEKGEWVTAVIDLSTRVNDPSVTFVPEEDGSYDVKYFSFRLFPYAAKTVTDDSAAGRYLYTYKYTEGETAKYESFQNTKLTEEQLAEKVEAHADYALFQISQQTTSVDQYVDVAYVAFADSMADIKTLIDTQTYTVSVSNSANEVYNTADDSCAHVSRDANEYHEGNTYYYGKCTQCGEYLYSRTLENSVKAFFSPYMISYTSTADPTNPRVHYNFGAKAFAVDADEAYFGFVGKDGALQFIWNRGPGVHGYGEGNDQDYSIDIGKANYAVIKMRASTTELSKNFALIYSTTGVDGNSSSAIPVASATAGEWETYVIDLAKVYGAQHALDAESNTYKVDTLYFHSDGFASTTKLDIAYMAFVEGDMAEVAKLVDTDTALVQTVCSGSATRVDGETGKCVDGCSTSVQVVDGVYKTVCTTCGSVVRDHGVKADAVNSYWSAETLYIKTAQAGTAASGYSSITGSYAQKEFITEDGETFLRLGDAKSNGAASGAWHGWFPISPDGNNRITNAGRYMVMKVRNHKSTGAWSTIPFWITSKASNAGTWAAGSFSVLLPQDDEWHVIVVDLAARSDKYIANDDGTYDLNTMHLRPLGGNGTSLDSTTDEVMDLAYMAFFDELADLKDIIKEETFELSQSGTSSAIFETATGACAYCTPVRVTDDADPRGYRYECSGCGKDYGIDFWVQSAKGYSAGTAYAATITNMIDKAGFTYNAIEFTGTNGTMMNFINKYYGGSNMYSPEIMAGRFLMVKMKGSVPEGGVLPFNVATDDSGVTSGSNPIQESIGNFTAATMPSDWTVVVVDLANVSKYSDGEMHKIAFSTATGDGGVATNGVKIDLAYVAVASTLEDVLSFAEDENVMFYGNNVANAPTAISGDCEKDGHIFDYSKAVVDGNTVYTYTCLVCGETRSQTVSADINWFASLDSMNKYQHNLSKNNFDSEAGVLYNRYWGNGGNHLNLTGGGGAGSATGSAYTTGKYFAIKYRVSGSSTTSLGLNVATGDKKNGNGSGLGTQYLFDQTYKFTIIEQGVWRTAIIDASNAAQWTSDGSAQSIYVMITTGGAEYTVDIAWAAVVDSYEEFKTLLMPGETYFDYGTNSFKTAGVEKYQDGTCVNHVCSEAISNNGKTITYTCNTCKTVVKQFTLDDSVTKYYSANQLNSTAKVYYGPAGTSNAYKYDGVNNVAYMETSRVQTIWQRMDHDMATTQTAAANEQFTENVGNAKYLVVKARSSDESAYLRFAISTMAKNCEIGTVTESDFVDGVLKSSIASYKKILEDGTTEDALCAAVGDQYYHGNSMKSVYLMGTGEATGEWVTYVIDLEAVCGEYYAKVEGQDYYDVDSFYFHNAGTNDIAYVAFVEGSWAEIDALVEEDVVTQITAGGSSTATVGKLVNVADGSDAQ